MRRAQRLAILATTSGAAPIVPTIAQSLDVDRVHWAVAPVDFAAGRGGSGMRGAVLLVGTTHYLYWLHTADTPSGSVATGYDPGDYPLVFPTTAGRTGVAVTLPAGHVDADDAAAALATALATIPHCSGTVVAANSDGTHRVATRVPMPGLVVDTTRAWADRGVSLVHGGIAHRLTRTGEVYTATSVEITAPVGSAITTPDASAIPWAVQIPLGSTVSTASTARPRLSMRLSSAGATSLAGSTVLYDFGQIPSSQIVAETLATIYLTPTQCRDVRDALDTVGSGRVWLCAQSTSGTHYANAPTSGAIAAGQQVVQNLRVATPAVAPTSPPPSTWTESGAGFPVWLNARLCLDLDPCTTGEHVRIWGSLLPATTAGLTGVGPIVVNQPVYTTGEYDSTLVGCRLYAAEIRASGAVRVCMHAGGSGTKDAPDAGGAVRFADLGSITCVDTAATRYTAPTGASAVYVPTLDTGWHVWLVQKSAGAIGYGDVASGSPATAIGRPVDANPSVRSQGASRGNTTMDEDRVGDSGDPATTSTSPTGGVASNQDVVPWYRIEVRQLPLAVSLA